MNEKRIREKGDKGEAHMNGVVMMAEYERVGLIFTIHRGSRTMKNLEDQHEEGQTASEAVELDVRFIMEQLGIDLVNWPADLPPLENK